MLLGAKHGDNRLCAPGIIGDFQLGCRYLLLCLLLLAALLQRTTLLFVCGDRGGGRRLPQGAQGHTPGYMRCLQ